MNGFERRKERKKENIRHAALELFSSLGIEKVNITDIAKKSNVSQVTIYNYFQSKYGLLIDVIKWFMNRKYEEFEKLFEKEITFPEKIERIIFEKAQIIESTHEDFLKTIVSKDPEIQKLINNFYHTKTVPIMMRLIEEGKNEGYIDKNLSKDAIIFYINMMKEFTNHPEIITKENKKMNTDLAKLFFYGLMGEHNN